MPAMKIAMSVLACAAMLLAGCEMADQYATFVPKILRQPSTEPPGPDPEPDVKELVRAGADTLFTAHPTAVAVSRPHRLAGRGFSACVKAMVVGPMNPDPQPVTLLVTIDHGKFTDRHRATSQDGCASESYERVETARLATATRTEGGAKGRAGGYASLSARAAWSWLYLRTLPKPSNCFPLWDGVCQPALGIISISSVRFLDARCFLWDSSETPSRAGKMQTEALLHFLLDSRNENLPEKRIHRNYVLTTVSMPPQRR